MPQRFLRPGITTSKRWNRCDWASQTLYTRLITLVDDYGRYDADPELIRAYAFPFGDPAGKCLQLTAIVRMLRTLVDNNLMIIYSNNGKEYLQILRWQERTRSASRYPEPTCEQLTTIDNKCSPPSPSPSPSPLAISHKPSPLPASQAEGFDLFWENYPRKEAKQPASKEWKKIKPEEQPEVMNGLNRWKLSDQWTKDNGQFIPHASTFLHQRRWQEKPRRTAADDKAEQAREDLRIIYAKKGIKL